MLIAKRISRTPPKGELWVRFPLGTCFLKILKEVIFLCAKYSVGTQIVHPIHGIGTVVDIKHENLFGKTEDFYIVKIANSELSISVPLSKEDNIHAVDIDRINKVYMSFKPSEEKSEDLDVGIENPKIVASVSLKPINQKKNTMVQRNKVIKKNLEKLKSGNIEEVVDVCYHLSKKELGRILAIDEKKMLGQAQKFIVRSFMLAFNLQANEAEIMLKNWMSNLIQNNTKPMN